MRKIAQELGAVQVRSLKGEGLHFVGGVPGLALCITGSARSWILRATVNGKRREMGLGPFPEIGLADAREAARAARVAIRAGVDPVAQRREARRVALTFDEAATAYITAHRAGWRNIRSSAARHRAWRVAGVTIWPV